MQYCRITEIYSTFLSCLRNGQHPAGCSQPFVFAIRLHPVSRDIPSQSECLNGCVVPLQLRILGTTRGEIVQAEGVYNCCSCSLKCSDLQRGKIKRKGSATCENQTSQYIQFDTSILMLQCCVCVCCAFGKGPRKTQCVMLPRLFQIRPSVHRVPAVPHVGTESLGGVCPLTKNDNAYYDIHL